MLTYVSLCVLSQFALHGLKLNCTACSRSSQVSPVLEMNRSLQCAKYYCTKRFKFTVEGKPKEKQKETKKLPRSRF